MRMTDNPRRGAAASQDWARTLNDREKSIKDREDQVKRLEHELTDHLKESEGKDPALVEREELSAQRERALAETIDCSP